MIDNKLLLKNKLFCFGLFLKVFLGTLLAASFLKELFIPFVDYYIASGFANPYAHFLGAGKISHFPYPSLMLYILSLPKIVFGWIAPNKEYFNLFLYRLPLIIADISIFFVLKSWLKEKYHHKLLWFYWLSPVLIYISYIHGQLDAIPIAFLFGSLYFLFKEKFIFSALFLGLALATKTNIALVWPFYFLYLFSKGIKLQKLFFLFLISIGTFLLINLPYLFDSSFLQMVFQNQEQAKLLNAFIALNDFSLFLIPMVLLLLFVRGVLLKTYNRDIFMMFLGFTFSIILLFIPPQQGWYFWLLPFLSYFYIKEEGRSPFLFFGLQAFYAAYFMVIKQSDYLEFFSHQHTSQTFYALMHSYGIDADKIVNLVFTALQTTLLVNCFWIYKKGLESYSKHKVTASPFLIGIGGNSGVGKTTISHALMNIFTPQNTTILCGDDMHKWQRGHEKWNALTHLDPKANHLHKEIAFLKKLKKRRSVFRRHYDHNTGRFTSAEKISPNNIVIFEGLHPFYISAQRALYDLKIFIKPSLDLMYHWKIIRDKNKRGYSQEKVIAAIKKREKDSKKYIETQVEKADIALNVLPTKKIKNIGSEKEKVSISYRLTLSNDVYIEPLLDAFDAVKTVCIEHQYTANDHQEIILKGSIADETLDEIANEYLDGLKDLGVNTYHLPKGLFGILILLITYYIFEKGEHDRE